MLLVVTDVTLGLALLLGGPGRTSSPSFSAIRRSVGVRPCGALLLAFAALTVAAVYVRPHLRADRAALAFAVPVSLAAGWYAYCALAFGISAALDPRAALTGSIVYASLTVAHVLLAFRAED